MLFLTFGRVKIQFAKGNFVWSIYIATKVLPTTKLVEVIKNKEYAAIVLDKCNRTFVVHVVALVELIILPIHSFYNTQIALLMNKEIFIKYSNVLNVFSLNSAIELPEHIRINNHSINLLEDKQLFYSLIYSLKPVELEILKTYIKTNLANSFIWLFKSPINTSILFV